MLKSLFEMLEVLTTKMFSSVELAPGPTHARDDDGRLETNEVLSLEIRSRLVFLSGCEAHSSPAAALALAQRALMDDPKYAAPYYWAAYTVTGSNQLE